MYQSIVEAIVRAANTAPNVAAIIDRFGEISYKNYLDDIKKTAFVLKNYGIKAGDNIVITASQDRKFLTAFHALQIIGAVPVPMERSTKPERIAEIAALTSSPFCLTSAELDFVKTINPQDLTLGNDELPIPESMFNEIADILFTTGTTGKSKGVVVTHTADVAVAENVLYGVEMKKGNIEIIPMPLNHAFGLRRYFSSMLNGSTVILLDGVINMKLLFESVEKHGATSMAMNPAALGILLKMARKKLAEIADKIDYMQFGSAHLSKADKDAVKELMPNTRLYDFYGSTEAGCACIINFNSTDALDGCIGRATRHSEFKIIGEKGEFLAAGQKGRLICSGDMIMKEYYKEPEITGETLKNGYVYSNDLCEIDTEGRIFYYGRCDDVINCGGNKIAPQDVEDCAKEYKGISDCACVGEPDKLLGEVPKLFVVAAKNYSEEELLALIAGKLEYYMVPKRVELIDKIPKTFNGKPLRRLLLNKEK